MTEVQQMLFDVLAELKSVLQQKDYLEAREATTVGEPGLALEVICDQLVEHNARVPRRAYTRIEAAGRMMCMPEQTWRILEPLVDG